MVSQFIIGLIIGIIVNYLYVLITQTDKEAQQLREEFNASPHFLNPKEWRLILSAALLGCLLGYVLTGFSQIVQALQKFLPPNPFYFLTVIASLFTYRILDIIQSKSDTYEQTDNTYYNEYLPNSSTIKQVNWKLLLLSLMPGFVLGGVFAGICEVTDIIENSEAFSPSFYLFVSLGTFVCYRILAWKRQRN